MTNHADLTRLLFTELHNCQLNLLDDGTQEHICKKLATKILSADAKQPDPDRTIENFKSLYVEFRVVVNFDIKTRIFKVHPAHSTDFAAGEIRWNSQQRSYCFASKENFVFHPTALADITEFIRLLMQEWRMQNKQTKTQP